MEPDPKRRRVTLKDLGNELGEIQTKLDDIKKEVRPIKEREKELKTLVINAMKEKKLTTLQNAAKRWNITLFEKRCPPKRTAERLESWLQNCKKRFGNRIEVEGMLALLEELERKGCEKEMRLRCVDCHRAKNKATEPRENKRKSRGDIVEDDSEITQRDKDLEDDDDVNDGEGGMF